MYSNRLQLLIAALCNHRMQARSVCGTLMILEFVHAWMHTEEGRLEFASPSVLALRLCQIPILACLALLQCCRIYSGVVRACRWISS